MHIGTIDSVDTEASVIVDKLLQLKLRNCKIVLSRPIRRTDDKVATQVVDDVITQLKELQIDGTGNEDVTRKDLGKKGLHLNQNGSKKFPVNLIAGIREL